MKRDLQRMTGRRGRLPLRDKLASMSIAEQGVPAVGRARLRNSTTVFLVGNIEPTIEWYKQLGFHSDYYPPGFAILRRDEIEIFLQQHPGYVAPDDSGRRERHAWNLYIVTDNVKALYEEFAAMPGVKIARPLCPQEYGMIEFDVMDLNGHRLVFAQPTTAKVIRSGPLPTLLNYPTGLTGFSHLPLHRCGRATHTQDQALGSKGKAWVCPQVPERKKPKLLVGSSRRFRTFLLVRDGSESPTRKLLTRRTIGRF